MTFIVACRKFVEANVDDAVAACCDIATGQLPHEESNYSVFRVGESTETGWVLCSKSTDVTTEDVVIVPVPVPKLFTWLDPTTSIELLRPLFRGVLRSAVVIWLIERKGGTDFDLKGIFYRRPFAARNELWHQTLVMLELQQHIDLGTRLGGRDLALVAMGHSEEGLPRLEDFKSASADVLGDCFGKLCNLLSGLRAGRSVQQSQASEIFPVVTTLGEVQVPAWFSYDQWIRKLAGTPQGTFIEFPLSGPQRVDGPAGSGKTLSLVLKALFTLKAAAKETKTHHAAFVVFSEDTKRKIVDSFLDPLDEDGFHTRDRGLEGSQSLTVTTLLEWSRRELKSIVEPFDLPSENPAQARFEQKKFVKDVLDRNLAAFAKGAGNALSQEMRELTASKISPVLVEMFVHEFGVVIKGMADGSLRRYLTIARPTIALPCVNDPDRRFVFALFSKYEEVLRDYGVVDLDDVAVSHIKLLQMPLRREARERQAFDSVFVDEAHSFNPNELAIFFLLTRRAELPPLVVAVDLPQALGDKGYGDAGLEEAIFEELQSREKVQIKPFPLDEVLRCPQSILDLVASIYAQGHKFLAPVHVPKPLRSARTGTTTKPFAQEYRTQADMLDGALDTAEKLVARLHCSRSKILIVLMHEDLENNLPQRLASRAEILTRRTDLESELRAQRLNHFVIAKPEYLHGLEFEAVVIVGMSRDEIPRLEHGSLAGGAAALFETQRVIDLMYLALTRSRREAIILYVKAPSFLLQSGFDTGLILKQVP